MPFLKALSPVEIKPSSFLFSLRYAVITGSNSPWCGAGALGRVLSDADNSSECHLNFCHVQGKNESNAAFLVLLITAKGLSGLISGSLAARCGWDSRPFKLHEGPAGSTWSLVLIQNEIERLGGKKVDLGCFPFNPVMVFGRLLAASPVFLLLNVG